MSWGTVAKELGIHVKVREKYARMHARALQRGFDFKTCGECHKNVCTILVILDSKLIISFNLCRSLQNQRISYDFP